jgi:hypothetical protein
MMAIRGRSKSSIARDLPGPLAFVVLNGLTLPCVAREQSASSPTASEAAVASNDSEQLFQQARTAHDQKKWEEAESLYRQAWEKQKTFKIAANLALVELKLEKPRDAAEHLDFALRHLPEGDPRMADARGRLELMLQEASRQIGTVTLHVSEPGAKISVDGEPVATTPLDGPLFLVSGAHTISAEKTGLQSATAPLAVVAGQSYELPLELEQKQLTPPAASPVPDQPATVASVPSKRSPLRTIVLISESALTLTAVGLGIAYEIARSDQTDQAAQFANDLNRAYPGDQSICGASSRTHPPACDGLATSRGHSNELARMETIAFVTAGGLAVTTIATYFLWRDTPSHENHASGVSAHFGASVAINRASLVVTGTF